MADLAGARLASRRSRWSISFRLFKLQASLEMVIKNFITMRQCDPDSLMSILPSMKRVYEDAEQLLTGIEASDEMKSFFVRIAVKSRRKQNERFFDLIEQLQVSVDPQTRADLDAAIRDYERGETVDLDTLLR